MRPVTGEYEDGERVLTPFCKLHSVAPDDPSIEGAWGPGSDGRLGSTSGLTGEAYDFASKTLPLVRSRVDAIPEASTYDRSFFPPSLLEQDHFVNGQAVRRTDLTDFTSPPRLAGSRGARDDTYRQGTDGISLRPNQCPGRIVQNVEIRIVGEGSYGCSPSDTCLRITTVLP